MIKEEFNSPKKGMNRHTHPSENKVSDYTFILNGNIQDATGDGDFIVENEPSNIKCTSLKSGYVVLKHKYDRVRERVYLFLVNEETGCSEIGYISAKEDFDINEVEELICKCDTYAASEIPLEEIFQEDRCDYTTLLSDYCTEEGVCTGCLNFSKEYPILNVVIRHSILGDELYWNDGFNPDRYVKLYEIESYFQNIDECEDEITPTCLQCDRLRMFTLFNRPCVLPVAVGEGGALRAGVYTIFIAYSDIDGTEVSDYFTGTNLISIFDKNNTILDQTQLDYRTNKSIQIQLSNLDQSFEYYKVVVGVSTGNDPGIVYKTYGVFPIDQENLTIAQIASSTESNSDNPESGNNLNVFDILSVRPSYLNSKLMTSANGYLFLGNLEGMREINLQPIVNLMGSLVKWGSGVAYEDLYEYGESTAKYKTYHRDEVIPLSIRFSFLGGYTTALYPFIARPPFPEEVDIMPDDNNRRSIEANTETCGEYNRDKVWQFVNTASIADVEPIPCESTVDSEEIIVPEVHSCITETTYETGDGILSLDIEDTLLNWINNNISEILASSDPELVEIQNALSDSLFYGDCEPEVSDNCDSPVLTSEEILAVEVIDEKLEQVSIPYDEYDPIPAPTECTRLVDPQDHDIVIEGIVGVGSTVWKKTPNTNVDCSNAEFLQDYGGTPLSINYHLIDMGSTVSSSDLYNSSIPVTLVDDDFKPFLHKNAIWFEVPFFNNSGRIVAHMSEVICGISDDNTNNKIRITVFDGCPTLVEKPAYGVIINDSTITNNPALFVDLDSSDFTGQQLKAYIAIDSPMKSEMEVDLTFSGTSGGGEILIDGEILAVAFNTNINTTASDFITANSVTLATLGISSSVSANIVTLIMTESQYLSLLWTQLSPDINVVSSLISQKHLLQPPCGCFSMYRRIPTLMTVITYDNIIFAKKQNYTFSCSYDKIKVRRCDVAPRNEGLFSYVESTLKYPCNKELFDSSNLEISINRIPPAFQSEFEGYYVSGIIGGNYVLSSEANFMDKPIRHYKFPDNAVSPFIQIDSEDPSGQSATNSFISPIGFRIDNEVINSFLDIAVDNGLLSQEERDKITGYELFRGDRATDRSIIAKGLLFDMRNYVDLGRNGEITYYPNYPLNDSGDLDPLNGRLGTNRTNNFFYTFHSPETHFEKPSLPSELYIDSYQVGISTNKFSPVKDHVTWVILGRKARNVAEALATAEIVFEILLTTANLLTMAAAGGISAIVAAVIAAGFVIGLAITFPNKFGKYKYEWLQTFENFGNPFNFGYYGVAVGVYKSLLLNTISNSKIRGLEVSSYLKSGRKYISNEQNSSSLYINNHNREDSVVLKFDEAHKLNVPSGYITKDDSIFNIPTTNTGLLGDYLRSTASPYGSIKRYVPNQYGSINSINWLPTGYCGDLTKNNSCDIVYGGDIFISRFALKRKFPFFTETAVGLPPNTPFKYSSYFNINTGFNMGVRGYVDFKTSNKIMNSGFYKIPENNTDFALWDSSSWATDVNKFYIKDEYKFLLYYYGFPYFLVESEFNCNYRYAGIEMKEDFYPNFGDTIEYTQEVNVPIREPNVYKYNSIYSARRHKAAYRLLPIDFSENLSIIQTDLENAVIASTPDNEEVSKLRSPWLNYLPADIKIFKKEYGTLVDIKGIESEMLWARFTDGYEILNTIDTLAERLTEQTRKTGLGGMFRQRALSFNVTDLGHNGTQHRETISTEFGHYSVDAKRGKVFELSPGAKEVNEISQSMDKWFKEQLPFKILKKFPNVNVDNQYNGIGIAMGWDDRTKRLLLTKRDYIPVNKNLEWTKEDGFFVEETDEKGDRIKTVVSLLDEDYFTPAHWTTAYSPLTKMWVSYYSFHPFYYITLNDHFKTGMNTIGDDKHGIWSHYPLVSSYQVFYGELFPFIVEYSLPMNGNMSSVDYIEFLLDVKKYYNKFDFSNIFAKGFNKAYIYNNKRNSGELQLITHNKDSRKELTEYPKYHLDNIEILQHQNNDFWTFNYLFDHVKDINSGLPIWLNDNVDVLKELNPLSMTYKNSRKDKIRGDFFVVRLIQDVDSRNKMIFRLSKAGRNYYI